jgi:hypothetical protein
MPLGWDLKRNGILKAIWRRNRRTNLEKLYYKAPTTFLCELRGNQSRNTETSLSRHSICAYHPTAKVGKNSAEVCLQGCVPIATMKRRWKNAQDTN